MPTLNKTETFSSKRFWAYGLSIVFALFGISAALIANLNISGEDPIRSNAPLASKDTSVIERGAYLAKIGNCAACHTATGGAAYAGGNGLSTPFGKVYAGNLTADQATGIGSWNSDHFYRAMHHGRSSDGRLLTPAFPYTNFSLMTRNDSNALFAFLASLPAVSQQNKAHELRTPFDSQLAIAVWRALFFKASPAEEKSNPEHTAQWNRGAYLVNGPGHCMQCHGTRNAMGALRNGLEFNGSVMQGHGWYAPSLLDAKEASMTVWSDQEAVRLLKSGVNANAAVAGPMAQVVSSSLQHLTDDDALAMVVYLKQLPKQYQRETIDTSGGLSQSFSASENSLTQGKAIYETHCASCHGDQGQGAQTADGKPAYPRLQGNRAVQMASPENLIQIILMGGYSPTTALNPKPFGMPPFSQTLTNDEIANLTSYIRGAWGNKARPVLSIQVLKLREQR
jgi:mono/diheme cytochrome c family protein